MIHVDRRAVLVPPLLISSEVKKASDKAEDFYSRPIQMRSQSRFEFDESLWRSAEPQLAKLFHGKCAYCESPVSPGEVAMHRPVSAVHDSRSKGDHDGYWWLAYEWDNLLLVCSRCNLSKQSYFPVKNRRAIFPDRGDQLLREGPLLLDPCHDKPELYLLFDESGRVRPNPRATIRDPYQAMAADRAEATIKLLSLNRDELVKARAREAASLLSFLRGPRVEYAEAFAQSVTKFGVAAFENALAAEHNYAGMRRQILYLWLAKFPEDLEPKEHFSMTMALRDVLPEFYDSESVPQQKTRVRRTAAATRRKATSKRKMTRRKVPKRATKRVTRRRRQVSVPTGETGYLERVEIRNFKSIRHLNINLPVGTSGGAGWKVLLGENGVGKSTVLKAIALALHGRTVRSRLKIDPGDLLRKLGGNRRTKRGYVRLHFTSSEAPIEMTFDRSDIRWPEAQGVPVEFLRAYGVTRLLPRSGKTPDRVRLDRKVKIDNLFNPYSTIVDADTFFAGISRRKVFGSAALSLKDLLRVSSRTRVRVERKRVVMTLHSVPVFLDELSDGYQSLAVLTTDIMSGVLGTVRDLKYATGLVLLDEIDAHLHPRWKMEIVKRLRATFPRIQFIATTHEPLCLRGLKEGEVTVFRRNGKTIDMIDDLPSTEGMRVDQLLTSNLFGLHSTIDPDLDEKFAEYYALLAKPKSELTLEEKRRCRVLKDELGKHNVFGDTRRDQMAYEAIDKYLVRELSESPASLRNLREDTQRKVAEIWSRT